MAHTLWSVFLSEYIHFLPIKKKSAGCSFHGLMYSGFMMSLRGWGSRCPHFTWIFSAADKLQTTLGIFMFHFIRQRETQTEGEKQTSIVSP